MTFQKCSMFCNIYISLLQVILSIACLNNSSFFGVAENDCFFISGERKDVLDSHPLYYKAKSNCSHEDQGENSVAVSERAKESPLIWPIFHWLSRDIRSGVITLMLKCCKGKLVSFVCRHCHFCWTHHCDSIFMGGFYMLIQPFSL